MNRNPVKDLINFSYKDSEVNHSGYGIEPYIKRERATKGECCMQHIIGLPKNDGIEMPLFEYEKMLYNALLEPGYLNSYPIPRS